MDPEADPLGSEVLAVAGAAVDLALPLAQRAAVHPLVADVAGEAGLVPGSPGTSHQLGYENGLLTSRTHLGSTPFGKSLGLGGRAVGGRSR